MAIHSETAKLMMPKYHVGTLDEEAIAALVGGEVDTPSESTEPRPIFLQPKAWTKAVLSRKDIISSDTRTFIFTLEHEKQVIGLPTGQHIMMRLRDPVTREAIIRSYTPISESSLQGQLHILIKVYFDTPNQPGGKMTKALDAIPCGHFVDFKGPIGHFEYLGKGKCEISRKPRFVKRFIMICGGSGITPIFQVLRAVMRDQEDTTKCLVLDGNRLEGDILCREDLDSFNTGELNQGVNKDKLRLLYLLSRPDDKWTGMKGRIGKELIEKELGPCKGNGEDLILICGPESLEKSVHGILNGIGWEDKDLLFF